LNQIEKLQTAILIFLGDRDDQSQVGFGQFMLGLRRLCFTGGDHLPGTFDLDGREVMQRFNLFQASLRGTDLLFQLLGFAALTRGALARSLAPLDFALMQTHFFMDGFDGVN
jgi:hypothetical protein